MDGTVASRKKVTQNDLRRIMNEQKRKFSETIKKIDSPLAKYPFKHIGFRLCFTHCIVYEWFCSYVFVLTNICLRVIILWAYGILEQNSAWIEAFARA
jgi:hypothetical protein